jgi:hypothetical protein
MTDEQANSDDVDDADGLWPSTAGDGVPPAVTESIANHKALAVTRRGQMRFRRCVSTLKWNHWFSTRDITRAYVRNDGRTLVFLSVMCAGVGITSLVCGNGIIRIAFSVAFLLGAPVAFLLGRGSLAAACDTADDATLMDMALKIAWATTWERLRMGHHMGASSHAPRHRCRR